MLYLFVLFKDLIMSKRIQFSISPDEEFETDWSKCFLCQADITEALVLPEKKNTKTGSGYTSLAKKNKKKQNFTQ